MWKLSFVQFNESSLSTWRMTITFKGEGIIDNILEGARDQEWYQLIRLCNSQITKMGIGNGPITKIRRIVQSKLIITEYLLIIKYFYDFIVWTCQWIQTYNCHNVIHFVNHRNTYHDCGTIFVISVLFLLLI